MSPSSITRAPPSTAQIRLALLARDPQMTLLGRGAPDLAGAEVTSRLRASEWERGLWLRSVGMIAKSIRML